jgi:amino acid transporter
MPRSGGDYIYVSRVLSPTLGFASNFSVAIWQVVGWGAASVFISELYLSPAASIIGYVTSNNQFLSLGSFLVKSNIVFAVAVIGIVLAGLGVIKGLNFFTRVNSIVYVIGLFSLSLIYVILAGTSNPLFIRRFNAIMNTQLNSTDAYHHIISLANANGFSTSPALSMLVPMMTVGSFGTGWFFWQAYMGGEIKGARSFKTQFYTMFGAAAINGLFFVTGIYLTIHTFGYQFLGAISYLVLTNPSVLPFPEGVIALLSGLASASPFWGILIAVTFVAWAWPLITIYIVMVVRAIFAWSFDRVLPMKLAEVNERFHAPVYATVVSCVGALIVAYFATYTPYLIPLFIITFPGTSLFSQLVSSVSAIRFPFKFRQLYSQSPDSKYRVIGLPLVTVTGIIATIYLVVVNSAYFLYPGFGLSISNAGFLLAIFVAVFVSGIAIYQVSKAVRKHQGFDLSLAFQEIPPE